MRYPTMLDTSVRRTMVVSLGVDEWMESNFKNLNPSVMLRKGRRQSSERKAESAQIEKSRL